MPIIGGDKIDYSYNPMSSGLLAPKKVLEDFEQQVQNGYYQGFMRRNDMKLIFASMELSGVKQHFDSFVSLCRTNGNLVVNYSN